MKVMKKILTMLFVMMMVLGMGTAVSAEEGTSPADKGSITIDNAIVDQTYSIYKIFDLESFYDDNSTATKRYAYKVASEWSGFFASGAKGLNYVTIDENGYVTWNTGNVADFAKDAIDYAKTNSIANKGSDKATTETVSFNNLELGYYLVDSSVGVLCSLDTTNKNVTIKEKNVKPTLKKLIVATPTNLETNTATIGDTINFQTTITIGKGAQKIHLYDEMDKGLTLNNSSITVTKDGAAVASTNYTTVNASQDTTTNKWKFDFEFNQTYLDALTKEMIDNNKETLELVVTYSATLNKDAVIDTTTGNENKTWLTYGDNATKSDESKTTTYSFEIPVFKFYKDSASTQKALAGVTFELRKEGGTEAIKFMKDTTGTEYRVALNTEASSTITIETNDTGKFTIKGLAAGNYELKEKTAPKGYNIPKNAVKIRIADDGKIYVNGETTTPSTQVEIENKTGTILPSTGGMGTTIMYIVGAALLIGSGVVLVTKKSAK